MNTTLLARASPSLALDQHTNRVINFQLKAHGHRADRGGEVHGEGGRAGEGEGVPARIQA